MSTGKDAAGIVLVGLGARAKAATAVGAGESLDLVSFGYDWGTRDSPVDIAGGLELGPLSFSATFDPAKGIDASVNIGFAGGAFSGVSLMFDDSLIEE